MSALEKMRKVVAKLDEVSERPHFGDTMFYVGKKPFASAGPKGIVVGLEPEHAATLVAKDSRYTYYSRAQHAVQFDAAAVPEGEWAPLVLESYAMVAAAAAAASKKKNAPKKKAAAKKRAK